MLSYLYGDKGLKQSAGVIWGDEQTAAGCEDTYTLLKTLNFSSTQ